MSFEEECDWRLENLYKESHIWLIQVATNVTRDSENAADMVSDLYLYLHKHRKKEIFWGISYNLIYCMRYIKSRWISKREKLNRYKLYESMGDYDRADEVYDTDKDIQIQMTYELVKEEVEALKNTKLFAQSSLYKMYFYTDDNLSDISEKIGISKSTTFNAIKKVKTHLKNNIPNPFKDE